MSNVPIKKTTFPVFPAVTMSARYQSHITMEEFVLIVQKSLMQTVKSVRNAQMNYILTKKKEYVLQRIVIHILLLIAQKGMFLMLKMDNA